MGVLGILLLVFLGIISLLLVLIVLVQSEEGGGLGGIFGGGNSALMGARSGNILTKITTVLSILFFVTALVFSLVMARPTKAIVSKSTVQNFDTASFTEKVDALQKADEDETLMVTEEKVDETEKASSSESK